MDASLVVGLIMFGMAMGAMLTYLNFKCKIRHTLPTDESRSETRASL